MTPVWVVVAYLVVQALENNVVLPMVMSRGMKLHPVAVLFSVLFCVAVLLADDHTIVRQGLRTLLESEEDIRVIGEAANGREAVAMAKALWPVVIVMDIAMPVLNGLEATRQIHKAMPEAKVLILSAHGNDSWKNSRSTTPPA
jgi:PleD family two-component response regulator